MSQSTRLSLELQEIAAAIDIMLTQAVGETIAWVLVCQTDGVAQYVSNAERADGAALIESLLERWKAGRADIPAHYNPDLRPQQGDESTRQGSALPEENEKLRQIAIAMARELIRVNEIMLSECGNGLVNLHLLDPIRKHLG